MLRILIKRALYGVIGATLGIGGVGAIGSPASAAEEPGEPGPGTRRVVFVGNNWDGTADLLAPRTFKRLARVNVIPDYRARMAEIAANPYRLAYFLAIRHPDRRGARPVRRRHVLLQRRQAGRDLAAVVRRRRRDQPRDRQDQVAVPGRRCALGPHGGLAGRAPGRRQRLDRQRRPRAADARRQGGRQVPLRRIAARERLHRRRQADPARLHRHGLQPAGRARPAGPARGGAGAADRGRQDVQDPAPLQRAQGAGRPRDEGHQHRGPSDDAVAGREEALLPALLPSTASWRWTGVPGRSLA